MKKFVIVSTVLLLIGASLFGYSLYHYIDVTRPSAVAVPSKQSSEESPTEEPKLDRAALDDSGIFSENYEKASAAVSEMSLEQQVGQMLLGSVSDASAAATDVKRYALGGVMFENESFDYMTKEQVAEAVSAVAEAAQVSPMLAVQEEGGNVNSVSSHEAFSDVTFDSPRNLYASGGLAAVEKTEDAKADFLHELGFNLNLAPVADLAQEFNHIMYSRSLSGEAKSTGDYAAYCAKFNQAKGVSVTLKHFPGYGTLPDTVESVVIDERDAASIRSTDYAPFKAGAEAGAHFIMVSNVVVKSIDPSHTAALSPAIHRELRDEVGFTGLIMTDLIDRADYSAYADEKPVAVAAVLAGNDVILVRDYATAYNAILQAAKDGTVDPDIIRQACTRIIAYKYTAGLIE